MASRLFQQVREQHGLCYTIYSYVHAYNDTGLFAVYTATEHKKAAKALKLINAEIARLGTDATEHEINRAVKCAKSSLLMAMESTISRARRLAYNLIDHGRYRSNDEIIEKLQAVSKKDLAHICHKILSSKTSTAKIINKD